MSKVYFDSTSKKVKKDNTKRNAYVSGTVFLSILIGALLLGGPVAMALSFFGLVGIFFPVVMHMLEPDTENQKLRGKLNSFHRLELADVKKSVRPMSRKTLINVVMDCHCYSYRGDSFSNCVHCKKVFDEQVLTSELEAFLLKEVEESVKRVETEQKKKLFKQKQEELRLNSAEHKRMVETFEDSERISKLREAKYALKELESLSKEGVGKMDLTSRADEWEEEFYRTTASAKKVAS